MAEGTKGNGSVTKAFFSSDLNLRMLDLASFFIGVKEKGGDNRGPMIETFQKAVDGKAQGEAWCCSFISYLIKETSRVHETSVVVPNTESVVKFWNGLPITMKKAVPKPGRIVMWTYDGIKGHCGIIRRVYEDSFHCVEGNTHLNPDKTDGVMLKSRPFIIGSMKLLGYAQIFNPNFEGDE